PRSGERPWSNRRGEDARRLAAPAPEAGGGVRPAGQADGGDPHHDLPCAAGGPDRRALLEHRAAQLLRPAGDPRRAAGHAASGEDPAAEEGARRGDGLAGLTTSERDPRPVLDPRRRNSAARGVVRCRLMNVPRLSVERADPDSPEASGLLEAYFLELRERLEPTPVTVIARWPEEFRGPRAAVVLAREGQRAVGCAGLRPVQE